MEDEKEKEFCKEVIGELYKFLRPLYPNTTLQHDIFMHFCAGVYVSIDVEYRLGYIMNLGIHGADFPILQMRVMDFMKEKYHLYPYQFSSYSSPHGVTYNYRLYTEVEAQECENESLEKIKDR